MLPAERQAGAGVFAVAFLLWLLNHPYQGIWHDARIYGLLAAHWLNPEAFARDLFFAYGSQGELSAFTPFFGGMVGMLGLDRAAWWVVFSGGAMWVGACLALSRVMLGDGFDARFAVLLGAVVVVTYSPNGVTFVLNENFSTARSWAIPLGLASVAALAERRSWPGLGLALASLLLHPLLGIWPLALCLLVRTGPVVAAGLASLPLAVAVLFGLANLDWPYVRLMSGDWLEFAHVMAPDIVIKEAGRSHLPEYAAAMAALAAGARWGSDIHRGLYFRLLLLSGGGLALALMASDWLPLEILVQGQAWRVFWLAIPLAGVALIDLGGRLWRASPSGSWIVASVAAMAVGGMGLFIPWLALMVGWVPARIWRRLENAVSVRRGVLIAAVGMLWIAMLPGLLADLDMAGRQMLNPWWAGSEWLHGLLAGGFWPVAALLAWTDTVRMRFPGEMWLLPVAGAVAMLFLIPQWDRRDASRRAEEVCHLSPFCPSHPFSRVINPGDTVYWPEREITVWFDLRTASYHGLVQRTGAVFSKRKFEEWRRREQWIEAHPDLRGLCADPVLDWVVLSYSLSEQEPRASAGNAHLHACADYRGVLPASSIAR